MTINEFKEKFAPDQDAQNAIWAHSCSNYGQFQIEMMIKDPSLAREVCCTRPQDPMQFGNMGVLLKGKVTAMFKDDMGSQITAEGERWTFIPTENNKKRFNSFMALVATKFKDLSPFDPEGYTESWVVPQEIIGVFVTRSFYERAQKDDLDAEDLEKFVGNYPLTILEN